MLLRLRIVLLRAVIQHIPIMGVIAFSTMIVVVDEIFLVVAVVVVTAIEMVMAKEVEVVTNTIMMPLIVTTDIMTIMSLHNP